MLRRTELVISMSQSEIRSCTRTRSGWRRWSSFMLAKSRTVEPTENAAHQAADFARELVDDVGVKIDQIVLLTSAVRTPGTIVDLGPTILPSKIRRLHVKNACIAALDLQATQLVSVQFDQTAFSGLLTAFAVTQESASATAAIQDITSQPVVHQPSIAWVWEHFRQPSLTNGWLLLRESDGVTVLGFENGTPSTYEWLPASASNVEDGELVARSAWRYGRTADRPIIAVSLDPNYAGVANRPFDGPDLSNDDLISKVEQHEEA